MKKLLVALAVLALVIVLLPVQEARAEYHDGDLCPQCNLNPLYVFYDDENFHTVTCSICGYTTTEFHFGGTATPITGPTCDGCGEVYGAPADPIEVNCVYYVAGVYYLNKPDYFPDTYDCHYGLTCWEGPVEFNQVVQIDGEYYLAANVDTMLYRAISAFFSKVAGFPATCTEAGQEDYWECLSCHRMYSDKDAKNEIQKPVAIPAGHILEETKKLEPTCTEPGHEAYWTCQRDGCGKKFSDKDGEHEITAPVAIDPLGHDWVLDTTKGNSGWDWDTRLVNYSAATAYLKCDRDGCKETATAVDNALQRSAPTYNPDTDQAEIEYTATVTKDGQTFTGNTTVSKEISERWIVVQFGDYGLVGDFDTELEEVMQDGEEHVTVDQTINCHDVFIGWSDPEFSYYRVEIAAESAFLYIYYSTTPQYQASGLTHIPEAPATCEEDGAEEYWTCENCGKKYSDENGKNEIKAPAAIGKLGHDLIHHDAQAATCTEIGWEAYDACSRCEYTTYVEKAALGHDLVHHDAQAATCTEIGWDAYDTCSRCDYTTYEEIPALGHDLEHHEGQEPTCTEIGWDAYDTCSRCDYTTYEEIPALGHDLIHHEAQAPTCTEIGWEAYDACSRCDYSTYAEIPALGHTEETDPAVAATCTAGGLTAGSHCGVCGAVLTAQQAVPAMGHWLGPWQPAAEGKHAAACRRCARTIRADCTLTAVPQTDPDAEPILLCPICGYVRDGAGLTAVEKAEAKGAVPRGRLTVMISPEEEETRFLTVAFETDGRLVQARGQVTVTAPAEALEGFGLALIGPDGEETPVVCEASGGKISFTLDFMPNGQPIPAVILKLIPTEGPDAGT